MMHVVEMAPVSSGKGAWWLQSQLWCHTFPGQTGVGLPHLGDKPLTLLCLGLLAASGTLLLTETLLRAPELSLEGLLGRLRRSYLSSSALDR